MLLIGWSHKYQEVLDSFNLGKYATDYSELSADKMIDEFYQLVASEEEILTNLNANHEKVIRSSYKNIMYVTKVLDELCISRGTADD